MASYNQIRGLEESLRHDARDLAGKLSMAIAMENEFIEGCKAVFGRFRSEDKSSENCRKAVYAATGCTEDYNEMLCMLAEHEKKLRKLAELQSFVGGWEVNFR